MSWHRETLPKPLPREPLNTVVRWQAEAASRRTQPNPNAMALATVDSRGRPGARIVLCKEIVPRPGYITFYTNYESRKGQDLAAVPRAAVVMHWDHLHRQVRIEGPVTRTSAADSDVYFASRHWQSRVGAWASEQSRPVSSRAALMAAFSNTVKRLGLPAFTDEQQGDPGVAIARPPHWGGYRLWAENVELWAEGESRLHDRALWTRALTAEGDGFQGGPWTVTRLQP
jgi:pyridoxamine 5'-phosphate oxidase